VTTPAVELRGICKRYGEVVANQDVNLAVGVGEVHALVGENGAGKTTLMRILYGLVRADAGEIWVRGQRVVDPSPALAIALGIGMVHQHFLLVPTLSVVENVVLGREPTRGLRLDLARAAEELAALAREYRLEVDPHRLAGELSVGEAQRVEILKLLWRGADILVLDEPTGVLTPPEARELYRTVRALCAAGKTALVITHKLDEVMAASDRVTVLRRGRTVGSYATADTSAAELARAMVGRDVELPRRSGPPPPEDAEVLLSVRELEVGRKLRGVSLDVRAGEILGVAGVEGNGQTELVLAIAGLCPIAAGSVRVGACAHVPEDRHARALVLDFSLWENFLLGRHRTLWGHKDVVAPVLAGYDIRPADPETWASALSGGNQQKLVVARELHKSARVVLAAQPTRGVDLGAIDLIRERLLAARAQGCAILLVSAELQELLALADRIVVMSRGHIVASGPADQFSEESLSLAMTSAREALA
jgi:simple sugar transport system ATP-binding protein